MGFQRLNIMEEKWLNLYGVLKYVYILSTTSNKIKMLNFKQSWIEQFMNYQLYICTKLLKRAKVVTWVRYADTE